MLCSSYECEKALTLLRSSRVRVLTNQSLNDIFKNRDCSGRIGKWAMELSEHVVDFEKRSAIKS
jgi:hypothetical protein